MNKIKELFAKYREMILYLIFGVGTTVIDFAVSMSLVAMGVNLHIANVIAWVFAVIFAYVTNRIFVFKSVNRGFRAIAKELAGFSLGRLTTLGFQELTVFVLYDCIKMSELPVKLLASVFVIILNYIFGKLLVFRKK